jgi:CheY-like chemotaxis protein
MDNSKYPILIADDDTIIQKMLVRILTKSGYEVSIAKNGKDALQKLSESFHPIVITDWDMIKSL